MSKKRKRYEYATIEAPMAEEREGSDKVAEPETEGTFLPPLSAASEEIKWKVTPPTTSSTEEFPLPPLWEATYKPEWDEWDDWEVDYSDLSGTGPVYPPTT